jgi:hypothetical protein
MFVQALVPITSIVAMTGLFTLMDRALTRLGYAKPYYAIHTFHNAAIVAVTARDVYASFTDFYNVSQYSTAWTAVFLCYALHLYHLYVYHKVFHMDDWLHHGLMVGLALPIGSTVTAGALMGATLFFTTGLPGGINYAMLFAERNGWITKEMRKHVNTPVHVWIRGPGCTAVATLIAATALSTTVNASPWYRLAAISTAVLTFWNGQYFMQQVLVSASSKPGAALADASNTGRDPKTDKQASHAQ